MLNYYKVQNFNDNFFHRMGTNVLMLSKFVSEPSEFDFFEDQKV